MQLALRSPSGRLPLMRQHPLPLQSRFPGFKPQAKHWGVAGLGDSNINPTTIWTPTTGYTSTAWGAPAGATYVAPTLVPTPACISGPEPYSAECQQQLMQAQQQNMAASTAANYAVDRANCENAWAANAAQYQALGMPVPPNDCAQRTYGLTLPGTTGSSVALLPNAQQLLDPTYSGPVASPVLGPGSGSAGGAGLRLTFTNLTSGDNSHFKVGDRWQLQITGASPNSPVSVNGGVNGANVLSDQGTTDSAGNWSLNGQMDQSQVGSWVETWRVNNAIVQTLQFSVAPSGSVVTGGSAGTGTAPVPKTASQTQTVIDTLTSKSISLGGTNVPVWALGLAAVAVIFMMRGK